jgi:hypothetical protein
VSLTLIIEIPLTFLLILPCHQVRVIGAFIQIILQIIIILTGNYAFFNILTIALMVIVMIEDIPIEMIRNTTIPKSSIILKAINAMDSVLSRRLQSFISLCFIIISFNFMIKITDIKDLEWWYGSRIRTAIDYQDLEKYMLPACLFAIGITVVNIISTSLLQIWIEWYSTKATYKKVYNILMNILFQFIALVIILMSCRPLKAVANIEYLLNDKDISKVINMISPKTENLHIFNGYGLFRRMTGVGSWSPRFGQEKDISIVSRPEIILEGLEL